MGPVELILTSWIDGISVALFCFVVFEIFAFASSVLKPNLHLIFGDAQSPGNVNSGGLLSVWIFVESILKQAQLVRVIECA